MDHLMSLHPVVQFLSENIMMLVSNQLLTLVLIKALATESGSICRTIARFGKSVQLDITSSSHLMNKVRALSIAMGLYILGGFFGLRSLVVIYVNFVIFPPCLQAMCEFSPHCANFRKRAETEIGVVSRFVSKSISPVKDILSRYPYDDNMKQVAISISSPSLSLSSAPSPSPSSPSPSLPVSSPKEKGTEREREQKEMDKEREREREREREKEERQRKEREDEEKREKERVLKAEEEERENERILKAKEEERERRERQLQEEERDRLSVKVNDITPASPAPSPASKVASAMDYDTDGGFEIISRDQIE